MGNIIIHCPINCEKFCFREVIEKIPEYLKEKYTLQILDHGILSLECIIQSSDELRIWTNILSNCYTIEMLRMEIESRDIPLDIQMSKTKKPYQVRFLEECLENALNTLLKISSPHSIALVLNMQYWKNLPQREIQGIFKKGVKRHPPLQFLLRKAELELHIALTRQHLKITMNLPVQTLFSQLKPHPTPVFPSVAYVMVQLGLEQIPQARRFIDAMCGAGNIALMVTQVLKDKFNLFVGGFDKDSKWIEIARENSQVAKSLHIEFRVFDLLAENFESSFPFYDYDILLAHPPYSHFVQYSNEVLEQLYRNLLQIFQKFSREKACLVINSPRSDILVPLISKFPFMLVQTIEIPRKTTSIKLWIIIKK